MGRKKNPVPSYLPHKKSGQARVRVNGRDVYLGKYGSPESKREYRRVIAELGSQPAAAVVASRKGITFAELVEAFFAHADRHYRDADGNPTSEIGWLEESAGLAVELYGHLPAAEFGPKALKAVRHQWVKQDYARTTINARVNRLRRMVKWAASEELVPVDVYAALDTVTGLEKGRTEARESDPVLPVPDLHVALALPHLNPIIRSMVLVQRLTGCRPQDVCRMRAGEIDRTVSPWVYEPSRHKTSYRGAVRRVMVAGAAQGVLAPLLEGLRPGDVVFSPARGKAARHAAMRAMRKSKVQPSQASRAKKPGQSKRPTPETYSRSTYIHAIAKACAKAGVPAWSPNQLRHTFGSEARDRFGLEAAQVLMGHTQADVTQVYAQRDLNLAAKIAEKMG